MFLELREALQALMHKTANIHIGLVVAGTRCVERVSGYDCSSKTAKLTYGP